MCTIRTASSAQKIPVNVVDMPVRAGSRSPRSRSSALATATRERSSSLLSVRAVLGARPAIRRWEIVQDATSPPTCPPTPSATKTYSVEQPRESWLSERYRPATDRIAVTSDSCTSPSGGSTRLVTPAGPTLSPQARRPALVTAMAAVWQPIGRPARDCSCTGGPTAGWRCSSATWAGPSGHARTPAPGRSPRVSSPTARTRTPRRRDAELLGELAHRRGVGGLAVGELTLGDRPGAGVLACPEGPAQVAEEDLQPAVGPPVQEQSRAGHGHGGSLAARRAAGAGRRACGDSVGPAGVTSLVDPPEGLEQPRESW